MSGGSRHTLLFLVFVLALMSSTPGHGASTNKPEEYQIVEQCPVIAPEDKIVALRQRVYDNWCPSKAMSVPIVVTAFIAHDGKLYSVKVEQTSGDAQLDADAIEAVMSASASHPGLISVGEGDLRPVGYRFDKETKPGHGNSGVAKYFASHPEEVGKYIAFYRIPLDVLKRYPDLFTEEELLSDSNIGTTGAFNHNLSGLPGLAPVTLQAMYQGIWAPFFVSHPAATKQQILDTQKCLFLDLRRERAPQ